MAIKNDLSLPSRIFLHAIIIVFCLLCVLPIILIISISLTSQAEIVRTGYRLIPADISLVAYKYIFKNPVQILRSYYISAMVSVLGTLLSLLLTSMLAYPLSRADFKIKGKVSFYIFFTMLFNGGLVPWYILIVKYLKMEDSLWVMIVPYLVVPWYVLLLRTFFQKIPVAIIEAAKIDGSSEFRTFLTIVLPLSKPGLATVGLFIVLQYWNDWWLSLLFISKDSLMPLQYMLYKMMANIEFLNRQLQNSTVSIDIRDIPSEPARMAMCILAAGPMLFIFPFFQKYFEKGLTVGSVKG